MKAMAGLDVSRETSERLEIYAQLVRKWTKAINLVAPGTVGDLWSRHFVDSAQIADCAPTTVGRWADLGSGGGFPGMVLAILAAETDPERETVLIESDQRKSAFLRTVSRETSVPVVILDQRIELAPEQQADVVSARALASLSELLPLAQRHLASDGIALFPKGRRYQQEVEEARDKFDFELEIHPSRTDPEAVILAVGKIRNA